ncbi:MAG: methyltransferase domain-containing protein [Salibacteraceae bacterium]
MSVNLGPVEALYTENLKSYGIENRSLGWNSKESQILRFAVQASLIDPRLESVSVNDLGCGYGEFYNYLIAEQVPVTEFNGYDISAEMLAAAEQHLGDNPVVKWHHNSAVDRMADYTFTSGIFNVRFKESEADWARFVKNTLRNMFEHSKKGIAFNLLTSYVDYRAENLYYADPSEYFDFCKTELSRYVTLIHDYPLYEWTILVKKEAE